MLAVVQMVYPTIKSDARLSLEILYFREIQTRTSPNVWAGASKEREREKVRVNRKLDDPRPSSELFALSSRMPSLLSIRPNQLVSLSFSFFFLSLNPRTAISRSVSTSSSSFTTPHHPPYLRVRCTEKKCVCIWIPAR